MTSAESRVTSDERAARRSAPAIASLLSAIAILQSSIVNGAAADAAPAVFSPELRPALVALLSSNVTGRFSLYAEDLSSSAAFGIDEDAVFNAWSLLKVPVAITVLKKVERGHLALDQEVVWRPEDVRVATTIESDDVAGTAIPLRDLVRRVIALSDNRASFALARFFNGREFQETLGATGMPKAPPGQPANQLPKISPKHYANLLRSLHTSTCLDAALARLLTDFLKQTAYTSQIPRRLPAGTDVAHMVGYHANAGEFHDCGIVYHPRGPYIVCVMSTGSTREEADDLISRASRMVYEHFRPRGERD